MTGTVMHKNVLHFAKVVHPSVYPTEIKAFKMCQFTSNIRRLEVNLGLRLECTGYSRFVMGRVSFPVNK